MNVRYFLLSLFFIGSIAAQCQSYENIPVFPLGDFADSLYREGYFRKVLPYAQATAERIKKERPFNADLYAKALFRLGEIEYQSGYYQNAESHLDSAYSSYLQLHGMNDDTAARITWIYGLTLVRTIKWEKGDSILTDAIQKAKDNPRVSDFAKNALRWMRGLIKHNQRNYTVAEAIYKESLHQFEVLEATNTEEYAIAIYYLSSLYILQERYQESLVLCQQVEDIRTNIFSKTHPSLVPVLNVKGLNNQIIGNFGEARDFYISALNLLKDKLGANHWLSGIIRYNLANVYTILGDYIQTEKTLKESLAIIENTVGKRHSDYPMLLANIATIQQIQGKFDEAEFILQESRQLRAEILTKNHPHYAEVTAQLAMLYLEKGEPAKALPLLQEALAIQIKIEGIEHTATLKTIQQIALCRAQQGAFAEADSLLQQVENGLKRLYGNTGKEVALNFELRSVLALMQDKNPQELKTWIQQAHQIRSELVNRATSYVTGRELEALISSLATHNSLVYRAAADLGLTGVAFDNALLFKNMALQTGSEIVYQIANSDNTRHKQTYSDWQNIQKKISLELAKPLQARQPIDSLEKELYLAESYLSKEFAAYSEKYCYITWKDVKAGLKPSEAVVEFIHYHPAQLIKSDSVQYAALVLLPNDTRPHYIPLFEEKQLERLLEKTGGNAEAATLLYAARSGKLLDERPAYGTELYNLIWQPLEKLLRGVQTVHCSPSGLLHRVSFAALPINSKKTLADRYALHQLGSTRSLVIETPQPVVKNYAATIFGGVQYDYNVPPIPMDTAKNAITDNQLWNYLERPRGSSDERFNYLPGTAEEADHLTRALYEQRVRVQTHTGRQATEEALKHLGRDTVTSPDILHIATHGFFFPDPEKQQAERLGSENVFQWNENPLFRSGLVLAGANQVWSGAAVPPNLEDGIATAYEISHLNLSNTKLVVLSACETGLGDIKGSEGVYGLQRAFKMAGAQYLLVSLWQVPDKETVAFMDAFYKNWLRGKTIHQAFAKAQKKTRKKYKAAHKWGAWVLIE